MKQALTPLAELMRLAGRYAKAFSLAAERPNDADLVEKFEQCQSRLKTHAAAALAATDERLVALANEVRPDLPEPAATAEQAVRSIQKLYTAHTMDAKTCSAGASASRR